MYKDNGANFADTDTLLKYFDWKEIVFSVELSTITYKLLRLDILRQHLGALYMEVSNKMCENPFD